MPIPCLCQIDGGTPQTVNPVGTVIFQATAGATTAVRINNFRLQSSTPGVRVDNPAYATSQQIIVLQFGIYGATPATGGLTPTPIPMDEVLIGQYNPVTSFRTFTTSLGTGFVPKMAWHWNTTDAFDLRSRAGSPIQNLDVGAVKSPTVWALVIQSQFINANQVPFNMMGTVEFTEDR